MKRHLLSLSTKSGMKDLFEGTKEELELSRQVVKSALSLIKSEVGKKMKNSIKNKDYDLRPEQGFLRSILEFVSLFCTELMFNFGNQLLTICDNRDVKRDGDLSSDEKVKLEALTQAEARKAILEEVLYETFIIVSETFKEQMIEITQMVKMARVQDWESDEEKKSFFEFLSKVFNGKFSISRLIMTFSIMVCAHKAEVLWLDEIAEALKNCAEGHDAYLLMR